MHGFAANYKGVYWKSILETKNITFKLLIFYALELDSIFNSGETSDIIFKLFF